MPEDEYPELVRLVTEWEQARRKHGETSKEFTEVKKREDAAFNAENIAWHALLEYRNHCPQTAEKVATNVESNSTSEGG